MVTLNIKKLCAKLSSFNITYQPVEKWNGHSNPIIEKEETNTVSEPEWQLTTGGLSYPDGAPKVVRGWLLAINALSLNFKRARPFQQKEPQAVKRKNDSICKVKGWKIFLSKYIYICRPSSNSRGWFKGGLYYQEKSGRRRISKPDKKDSI
jgi:hypothetical protein